MKDSYAKAEKNIQIIWGVDIGFKIKKEYYIDDSDFRHSMAYRDYFWQKLLNM